MEWLLLLPIALPLLLSLLGLKVRRWQFALLANLLAWTFVILRWKQHPMNWWEAVIMALFLLSLFTGCYDNLTPTEFRKGRRYGQGLDYWCERGTVLWRLFKRRDLPGKALQK